CCPGRPSWTGAWPAGCSRSRSRVSASGSGCAGPARRNTHHPASDRYAAVVSGNVPASTRTLRVLTFLATQPGPVPMERIASAVGLPRSSTYHLLRAMSDEGFVVHLPEEKRYGLGVAAFEIGSAYLRHDPLERL